MTFNLTLRLSELGRLRRVGRRGVGKVMLYEISWDQHQMESKQPFFPQ